MQLLVSARSSNLFLIRFIVLEILRFCHFGLKLPIHAHFWGVWGIFPPDMVTHRSDPQKDHPCVETRRLSHSDSTWGWRYVTPACVCVCRNSSVDVCLLPSCPSTWPQAQGTLMDQCHNSCTLQGSATPTALAILSFIEYLIQRVSAALRSCTVSSHYCKCVKLFFVRISNIDAFLIHYNYLKIVLL